MRGVEACGAPPPWIEHFVIRPALAPFALADENDLRHQQLPWSVKSTLEKEVELLIFFNFGNWTETIR